MSLDGWLTLIIITAVVVVMAREKLSPTAAVLGDGVDTGEGQTLLGERLPAADGAG